MVTGCPLGQVAARPQISQKAAPGQIDGVSVRAGPLVHHRTEHTGPPQLCAASQRSLGLSTHRRPGASSPANADYLFHRAQRTAISASLAVADMLLGRSHDVIDSDKRPSRRSRGPPKLQQRSIEALSAGRAP